MDDALTNQVEDLKRYNLGNYRYFFHRQENGLAWLFIVTTIGGEFKVTSMYYDNPQNLDFSRIENCREELEQKILEDGERETLKKTGPIEVLLATFHRQFRDKVYLAKELFFYINLSISQWEFDRNPEHFLAL